MYDERSDMVNRIAAAIAHPYPPVKPDYEAAERVVIALNNAPTPCS